MRSYEDILLRKLQRHSHYNEEPLANVKNALGSIAYAKGNPLTKTEITLLIDLFFYDVIGGGWILAPALPPALQTSLPTYIFGLTDYYGGYLKLRNLVPSIGGWNNLVAFGTSMGIYGYNLLPVIAPAFGILEMGDMFMQFVSPGGLFFGFVRVRCQNVSYGTFLNSFVSDLITINTIRYIVPGANVNQFVNPLIFGYQSLFGKVTTDSIDPRLFITPKDFQQQIADIPVNLPIDKNMMLGFQTSVFCQNSSWVLFVEKVEPLTYKR